MLQHFVQVVHSAVTGGFRTGQGTAVGKALTGEHAVFPGALQASVLSEQVPDFSAAYAHISCRDIGFRTDVTVKSGHKALAKTHDLTFRPSCGIKIRTALAAANRKSGQGILENLFKAQEFDNAGADIFLKAQTALVGAYGTVELATIPDVCMYFSKVVYPNDPEGKHPLRFYQPA